MSLTDQGPAPNAEPFTDYEAVPIAELASLEVENVWSVTVEGEQPNVDYATRITHSFPWYDDDIARIGIVTSPQKEFLKEGSEAEAQAALVGLARATHAITSGVMEIHPFSGAVRGSSVWTGNSAANQGAESYKAMAIVLAPNGHVFSEELRAATTKLARTAVPSPEEVSEWAAIRARANKTNPNQVARDEARDYGIEERWQAEFDKYNPVEITSHLPMAMTLGSVARLMTTLKERGRFNSTTATVRVGNLPDSIPTPQLHPQNVNA